MDRLFNFHSHLDELKSSLEQANAMLTVASTFNFLELNAVTTFNYFLAANEIVTRAKGICRELEGALT